MTVTSHTDELTIVVLLVPVSGREILPKMVANNQHHKNDKYLLTSHYHPQGGEGRGVPLLTPPGPRSFPSGEGYPLVSGPLTGRMDYLIIHSWYDIGEILNQKQRCQFSQRCQFTKNLV